MHKGSTVCKGSTQTTLRRLARTAVFNAVRGAAYACGAAAVAGLEWWIEKII
ncbi:hypothetical protein Q3V23_01080 [Streptomyces sp. VNUA116]|uniref:hypothetical protein n=1 Tax=Streptomyces sp. VNUA116 TaxID=3062449 RepID=UPI0026759915|nr:hypothetical protein [Streptomyces sp. VNUA116]WKU42777.1 hypothetical protein Q3V23_01080 [Streptomyces sp. VNUA116]